MMHFIIAAILNAIAGQLDEFAARICKDMGCEVVIFASLEEITQALTPPPTPEEEAKAHQLDAVVDDENALPAVEGLPALEAPKENLKLEAARQLARSNPQAVANIMRDWVNGEAG